MLFDKIFGYTEIQSTCRYENGKIVLGFEKKEYDRNGDMTNSESGDTMQTSGFISEKEAMEVMV